MSKFGVSAAIFLAPLVVASTVISQNPVSSSPEGLQTSLIAPTVLESRLAAHRMPQQSRLAHVHNCAPGCWR